MAYSTQQAVSDGTLALLDVSITYLERDEIHVYFDDVEDAYPWAWVGVSDHQISFSPAVPNTVVVMVVRKTDLSAPRHVFTLGAAFTSVSLDEDIRQILHISQEASEQTLVGDFFQDINMHGHQITNLGPAIGPNDAVPLAQYISESEGAVAARAGAEAARDEAVAAKDTAVASASTATSASATASTAASTASTAATTATTQAGIATAQASASAASALSAATSLDDFEDVYLGTKAVAPTLDNDGDPLMVGALYYDSALTVLRVYTGSVWADAATAVLSSSVAFTQAGAGAVVSNVRDKLYEIVSAADFGAVGVGDDVVKLQAALDAAAGGTLVLNPGVVYSISSTLEVPAGTTIVGYGATLQNTAVHITLLELSTGCNVYGLELIGAGGAYSALGTAIHATGVRNGVGVAPTYLSDITIRDCVIKNIGSYGVALEYVARSTVDNCSITNLGYAGVFCFSCDSLLVQGNYIEGLVGETGSGELNAYGVTFTSLVSTADFVRDPQSQYCRAIGNLIRNIPTWHGMDTHGGTHCDFIGNRIENCRRGIILTNLTTIGANHCTVHGNTLMNALSGTNSNGSQKQGEGIWDIGASSSLRNQYNCIVGNTVYQHGSPTQLLACVYIQNAEDGVVRDNVLMEPYSAGVGVYSDVRRYSIKDNLIINPKGAGVGAGGSTDFPSGILFSGADFTSVTVEGNTIVRNNAGLATKVGEIGIIVANTASKLIRFAKNVFDGVVSAWSLPETTGVSGEVSGSYTGSLTGCTTVPTGTIRYALSDEVVTLSVDTGITGTSNTTALTITGMPLFVAPTGNRYVVTRVTDAGVVSFGVAIVSSAGVISLFKDATLQALTSSGTKGVPQLTLTYLR